MIRDLDSKQPSCLTLIIPPKLKKWLPFDNKNVEFMQDDYKIITNVKLVS